MALTIISMAVVFVYVIAAFFRPDLVFKFPGVMSVITGIYNLDTGFFKFTASCALEFLLLQKTRVFNYMKKCIYEASL